MVKQDAYLRRRSRRKIFKIFWFFSLLTAFVGLAYFLVFSKYFLAKDVRVMTGMPAGETEDSDRREIAEFVRQELEKGKFGVIPGNNILFLDKNGLVAALLGKHSFYKTLKIDYQFEDRTLIVSGETRKAAARACLDENCCSVDEDGIAFYPVQPFLTPDSLLSGEEPLFMVNKETGKEILPGSPFLPKELVGFVSNFKKLADDEGVGLKRAVIEKEYLEAHFVKLVTGQDWYVLTVFDFDPQTVIESAKLIVEKELKGKPDNLEYVDLRYKDKAYYKLR